MKKVMLGFALLAGIVLSGTEKANAQTLKIGYFDLETMISLMPGTEKIDSLLQVFVKDSINAEYDFRVTEFNYQDSVLKADSAKMLPKIYQERKTKLFQEFYLLQNWQEYSQQMYQQKQQELVGPYAQKAVEALRKVIEEEKYTHVFKSETFYDAPKTDDLIPKVAKKLGVTIPNQAQQPQGSVAPKR
jgi:Skp family chaperone for outer membrane proteins